MINPNNNLPLTAQKQLKKVTQASLIDERKQRVEAKSEDNEKDPPQRAIPQKARPKACLIFMSSDCHISTKNSPCNAT